MSFPERLATLRKGAGLSQRVMAERIGVHLTQVQRYESGASQPTLDVIRRMATTLQVSADVLVFDDARGPQDADLRLMFEAVDQLPAERQATVRDVVQALLVKFEGEATPGGRGRRKA